MCFFILSGKQRLGPTSLSISSPVRPALHQRSLGLVLCLHSEVGLNQVVGSQATQHRELVRLEVSAAEPMVARELVKPWEFNRLLWIFNR